MVVEQRPQTRQKKSPAVPQATVVSASPPSPKGRRSQSQNWQQRRQELLRRDKAMGIVFGSVCLAGTLLMLYVAGQASATGEGYQLAEINRKIREEDAEHVRLLSQIRSLEDSNAMARVVAERKLVRTPQGIHYLGEKH